MQVLEGSIKKEDYENNNASQEIHALKHNWVLWAHLPHDSDWTLKSYVEVCKVKTIEETVNIMSKLPISLVKNCMLFFMKEGVKPHWEDPSNRKGGCFSYKVLDKNIYETWKQITYVTAGNTISNDNTFNSKVTGITISPKKKFCVIKIWISDCNYQNPNIISVGINDIVSAGCIFKKHNPEY